MLKRDPDSIQHWELPVILKSRRVEVNATTPIYPMQLDEDPTLVGAMFIHRIPVDVWDFYRGRAPRGDA